MRINTHRGIFTNTWHVTINNIYRNIQSTIHGKTNKWSRIKTKTSVPALKSRERAQICAKNTRACLDPKFKLRLDLFYSYLIKVQNKSKCAQ